MTDLVKQAVDKQIKIIEEQQQKAQEFIGKRVCICKTCTTYEAMPHLHITCLKNCFGFNYQVVVANLFYCLSWNQDDFEYRVNVTKRLFRGQGEIFLREFRENSQSC